MGDYYINLMRTWNFIKNGDTSKKWGIGGLRYRNEEKLRLMSRLVIGESVRFYDGTVIKRVDPNTPLK